MDSFSFLPAFLARKTRRPLGKRGAIGVAFAVGSTALLGMGALATEAGIWLTVRRNAQNAADAAAYAGATRLSLNGASAATAAAGQVVGLNGFTHNTATPSAVGDTRVLVEVGFVTPAAQPGGAVGNFVAPAPNGSSPNAVRVQVWQVQRIGFAQLISRTAPVAWGGAVAMIEDGGPACTLSIPPPNPPGNGNVAGQTEIGGSTSVQAPNCVIASNHRGRKSINIFGVSGSEVTVAGLRASGQCYNCNNVNAGGYTSGAPQTPDPYAYLRDTQMPTFTGGQCASPTYLNANGTTANNQGNAAIILLTAYRTSGDNIYTARNGTNHTISRTSNVATCNTNIDLKNGQTLVLQPGTYFFNDSSIDMRGGNIICDGCRAGQEGVTLVFTGSNPNKVGTLRIEGGNFELIAPGPGYAHPPHFEGVVIYQDSIAATQNNTNKGFKITGNPSSTVFGGIYVPNNAFEMYGTSGMNQTTAGNCVAVVAAHITFSGNSSANIDACEANGTKVARVRYVRLVQ